MVYLRTPKPETMPRTIMRFPTIQAKTAITPMITPSFKPMVKPTIISGGKVVSGTGYIGRPAPPRPRLAIAPGKIQNALNQILGATPEQPIRVPIQFGQVEVKAERGTQNLLLGLGGLALVGILLLTANR